MQKKSISSPEIHAVIVEAARWTLGFARKKCVEVGSVFCSWICMKCAACWLRRRYAVVCFAASTH